MNTSAYLANHKAMLIMTPLIASLMLVGCASKPSKPEGAEDLRNQFTQLQTDPQLGTRAPIAMKEAEEAIEAAEKPRNDDEETTAEHLVFMAKTKLDIARAVAERELYENQREDLSDQRYGARLDARTRELQAARNQTSELQRQIAELNAKSTERGIVMTLGDVLFTTGQSELKPGAANNLSKLLAFLREHSESHLTIEGHTDSAGNEPYNLALSQRRAEAVKAYLVSQGIDASRVDAVGRGEDYPVADNTSPAGRQLNRRVEVIIADTAEP